MTTRDLFLVADQWEPRSSGMGVYAYEIARRLPRLLRNDGFGVSVAVRADAPWLADAAREGGASVVPLLPSSAPKRAKLFEVYGRLPMRARGWRCWYSLDHKLPASALLPRRRIATVHDVCPIEFPGEYGTLKRIYFGMQLPRVLRHATEVATVSEHTARKLVQLFRADPARMIVSPNGFDGARFSPDAQPGEGERLRAEHGIVPGSYHLVVGRISPRKNFGLVVEAVRRLRQRGEDPRVVVAGPPGWRDESDWRAIAAHGLAPNFIRASYMPFEQLPALYRQSRGLLYPSFSEGFGIPVLESLACGAPVVVARGTACAEVGGPLVEAIDPRDADALAAWMQSDHPVDATAREAWLSRFSWDRTAETIAAALAPRLAAWRRD